MPPARPAPRTEPRADTAPAVHLLPGRLLVTFLVQVGCSVAAIVVPPQRFTEGLRAACDALGFAELQREDWRPEELLPWAGNV